MSSTATATATAAALGRALGLPVERAELLAERSNAIVALEPAGVVARVATVTAAVGRDVRAALGREVALAARLAAAGAPVVAPIGGAGPHERDGLVMRGVLGADGGWVVRQLEEARERLGAAAHVAVHGDAGLGNALESHGHVVWTDWEDAMLAPRLWDAACVAATPEIFGEEARARAALAGLGVDADDPSLAALVRVRALQLVPWSAFNVARGAGRRRLDARLAWLR